MEREEMIHILSAIVVFTAVLAFGAVFEGNLGFLGVSFVSAAVIIITNIYGKKLVAHMLDSDVEHRVWELSRYGFAPEKHFKSPWKIGIFLPLILTVLSLGLVKLSAFLTYETSAKKVRAAKRFGYYSYTEMTDWHNALIGGAGIITTLLILVISYFSGFEPMAKAAALYAFWNMFPVSNLDGTQIFFGSKIVWAILALVSSIAALYSVILV